MGHHKKYVGRDNVKVAILDVELPDNRIIRSSNLVSLSAKIIIKTIVNFVILMK